MTIANNVATCAAGGEYARINQRFVETIFEKHTEEKEEDTRPVREVVHDMWEKLRERRETDGSI